jgi:hypothetical protein
MFHKEFLVNVCVGESDVFNRMRGFGAKGSAAGSPTLPGVSSCRDEHTVTPSALHLLSSFEPENIALRGFIISELNEVQLSQFWTLSSLLSSI